MLTSVSGALVNISLLYMSKLGSEFAMKGPCPLNYFLFISITRNSWGIFLSQKKYAQKKLYILSVVRVCPLPSHNLHWWTKRQNSVVIHETPIMIQQNIVALSKHYKYNTYIYKIRYLLCSSTSVLVYTFIVLIIKCGPNTAKAKVERLWTKHRW